MDTIKSKLPQVGTTIFTEMSALAQKYNAVNLSQGFPNFKVDSALINLVKKSMDASENQYAPMPGDFELRNNLAQKYKASYNAIYNPNDEVVITAGATQAIFTIISTLIDKDDEVILFDPSYDCYAPTIELFKGKPIRLNLQQPNYTIDWNLVEEKISSKTKLIIINTPHNPTGSVISYEAMERLNALAKQHSFFVLSDEVYEHIIFDEEKHASACLFDELKARSFIVGSFGKTFHVTGWKIGFCLGPKYLMDEFKKIHQFNVFCVNRPMQSAIAKYISDENNYKNLPVFYQKKRDYFSSLISNSRFKILPCKGTYFLLLDYSDISDESDIEFAIRLTKEYKLATIPVSVFYQNKKDDKVIRVCFAKDDATLKKAADIINSI